MKTAIITGATGFIGIHLVNELIARNIEVIALCRKESANISRLPKNVTVIECSMDDYFALPSLLNGRQADVFFHLAWEGATGPGRADASLQLKNAARTLEALKAAKAVGCEKFTATGTVYENFNMQMAEANVFKTPAFYILSKKYARDMAQQLSLKLGIGFSWCTFCHPIGFHMKPEQLIAYTVKSLLKGVPAEFGPAADCFDIIDVEDLAYGLFLAGDKLHLKTDYYIGSGTARPLKDYLIELPDILNTDTPVLIGKKTDDGLRFDPKWFDSVPFMTDTGFAPKNSFKQSILKVANTFRDYQSN